MAHFQDRDLCGGGYAGQKMALVLWRTPDGKRELSIVRKPSPPPGGMKSNGPHGGGRGFYLCGLVVRLQLNARTAPHTAEPHPLAPLGVIGSSPAEVGRDHFLKSIARRAPPTGDGVAFTDLIVEGHRETWPIRSKQVRYEYIDT